MVIITANIGGLFALFQALCMDLFNLFLTATLPGNYNYYLHLTDEKTEA